MNKPRKWWIAGILSLLEPGLGQIAQVTQQTTAHAEQCAAAAQEFSSQAQHLDTMLRRFKVNRAELPSERDPEAKGLPART